MTGRSRAPAVGSADRGQPSTGADRSLTTETIFETLSNRRRRYALHYLGQVGEPVTVRDLSEQIAAWENAVEPDAVTPKMRKRVYTALHQTHLPKMDRLGVVRFDSDRGRVTLTESVEEFDIYLDVVSEDDIPWSEFYLALGGLMTALVTVGALGIWPFSILGGFGYALLVALTVTALGGYHTLSDQRKLIGSSTATPSVCPPEEIDEE